MSRAYARALVSPLSAFASGPLTLTFPTPANPVSPSTAFLELLEAPVRAALVSRDSPQRAERSEEDSPRDAERD